MILGIGVDVVHVGRIRHWESVPGLVERFFHPEEAADARRRGAGESLSLAARFAAKEAFGKALGTSLWSRMPNATFYTFFGPTFVLDFTNGGTGMPTMFW